MSLVNPRRPQLEQQQQPQTQQPQQLAAGSGLPPAGMFSGMAAAGGLARAPATTRRDRPVEAQVAQVLPPPRTAGAIPPLQAQAAQQQQQQFDMGADARGTARYYRGGAAPAPLPAGREAQGVAATGAAAPSQGAAAQRERGTTPPGAAAQQHAQAALLAALMPGRHGTPAMPPGTVLDQPVYLRANGATYIVERVIGNGSFGVVLQARTEGTGEVVAIKRVLQDKRYKNRELQIMRMLRHPNVVDLRNSFYVNGAKPEEVYLNLVQEFVPETVYKTCRDHVKRKIPFPHILVKLYIFQLCRALAYIHSMGACHRDIKPQNLLVDTQSGVLKLCDFGSAKVLQRGESNVSYICSRYYRAPELIFGATNYTTAIDIWSAGCVMAELLLGQPLFPGESGVDQLVEIIKVLGTPTHEQIQSMNRNYPSYNFPDIKPHPWSKVLRPGTPPEAVDLIGRVLLYSPQRRPSASELCVHPFFDELRQSDVRLPNGNPLPSRLLDFTPEEIASAAHLGISRERLMGGSTVGAGAQPFSQPAIGGSASTATALPMLPHTQPQQAPPPQMQDEMSTVP